MKPVVLAIALFLAHSTLLGQLKPSEYLKRMEAEKLADPAGEKKVRDLLKAMTLEEKVGQMTQLTHTVWVDEGVPFLANGDPGQVFSLDTNKFIPLVRDLHIGSFLNGIAVPPQKWYDYITTLQRITLRYNRHGIPMIYGMDHMHGVNYIEGGTIFPHNINLASTFDPRFAYRMGQVTSTESADLGHHWIFAPVYDIGRNPRFPRFYETLGEDPFLAGMMGAAIAKGIQENKEALPFKQAATAKHYLGYSDPKSGWDRSPAEISDQTLYEFHVPSFAAGIQAGVKTVMINSGEINGIPVHASYRLLTTLLRDELGFKGVTVTDWQDIMRLHDTHKTADSQKEAVYQGIMAGVDMSMTPYTTDFHRHLVELVKEGRIPMARIDLSVARILRLKVDLGLFENPYPRNDRFDRVGAPAHRQSALETARESLVLLKNEGVLPLEPGKVNKIVVTGPYANMKRNLAGGWSLRWIPTDDRLFPADMPTVWTALQQVYGKKAVMAREENLSDAAQGADAIIVVAGELPYSEGSGNVYDLTLDESQLRLIRAAQATGKPVVVVMVAGRPRVVREVYPATRAFLWAGLPGFEGATAIAEVISGAVNPSGKLSFSYPNYPGMYYTYDHKYHDLDIFRNFTDNKTMMAFFGDGLSYTTFRYDELKISATEFSGNQSLKVSVKVTNTGSRAGKEAVLWYLTDEYASVTRPVKQLKHFEKQELAPGQSRVFEFEITPQHLSFPVADGSRKLEDGYFRVSVGGQEARFQYRK